MGVGPSPSERIEQHIELPCGVAGKCGEVVMSSLDNLPETVLNLLRSGSGSLQQRNSSGERRSHRIEQIGDYGAPGDALQGSHAGDDLKRGLFERHSDTWFGSWHVVPLVYTFGGSVQARCTLWQ